jgi:hypothetical protein
MATPADLVRPNTAQPFLAAVERVEAVEAIKGLEGVEGVYKVDI